MALYQAVVVVLLFQLITGLLSNPHPRHHHEQHAREHTSESAGIAPADARRPQLDREPGVIMTDVSKLLTDEEMLEMRRSFYRNLLLDKLHLKAPPNKTLSVEELPEPVQHELNKQGREQDMMYNDGMYSSAPSQSEAYYGTTKQSIVIGKQVPECPTKAYSACFELELSEDLDISAMNKARLSIHKQSHSDEPAQSQTLVMYELRQPKDDNAHMKSNREYHLSVNTTLESGWVHVDVEDIIRYWTRHMNRHRDAPRKHLIQIVCTTCHSSQSPISLQGSHAPFLNMKFNQDDEDLGLQKRRRRNKRTVSFHAPTASRRQHDGCRLERLDVDLGDDYGAFQQPRRLTHFNYCTGSCSLDVDPAMLLPQFRQQLLHDYAFQKKVLHMCCVADKLDPLSVIYITEDTGTIMNYRLPNMMARSCSCK